MSTVETVNSGLTHFPMGRGNYLRRAGLPFVRFIFAAVLLGGAVSQALAQTTLDLSTYELETFSFTLTEPSSIQSFTITATDLMDGVIVSPPSQFEVSKNTIPTDFQNSISFSTFEFSPAVPTTVLVRMKAQTLPDSVSGEVINVSTMGVISPTVALTGTLSGWTYAEWTNDAGSGIDQNNYYTHKYALSGSGDVRVNGVTFTSLTGNYVTGKMSFQNIAGEAVDPTAAFTSQVAGSSAGLVSKYRTGDGSGGAMIINLAGLAINTRYELSLYSYSSSGNERVLRFYSGTEVNEREIDTNLFGGTAVALSEYHGNGMRVIYNYTSDGEGNAQIKIDPATIAGTPEFFHLGALSNRQVAVEENFDFTTTAALTVTINAYIGTAGGVVVIPSTIRGNPVTAIGATAFASNLDHRDEITQVIIPNTVLTIGAQAFENCIGLTTMKIPNSVTSIAFNAFRLCTSLQSVEVGSGVTSIGNLAFYGCSLLHDVYFAASTRPSVGLSAFSGIAARAVGYYPAGAAGWSGVPIDGLNLVSMPSGIARNSFTVHWVPVVGATYTIEVSTTPFVELSDIVQTVPATASETSKLITGLSGNTNYWYRVIATIGAGPSTVSSPVPVTTGETDFAINTNDGEVTITGYTGTGGAVVIPAMIGGNPVTGIGGGAFLDRTDLSSISIPNSVTSIGGTAFKNCRNLSSMIIPNGVTSLGASAFSGCDGLTSITLGSSVANIGESTFSGCVSLSSIIIPSSVNSIGKQAFDNCRGLTAITIPSSVITVGELAFSGCNGLTSFTIGSGVTTIGLNAFLNCSKLISITIPNNVTSLGNGAFLGCYGLTSLTIGSGVTSIGSSTFSSCRGLTSVTIPNTVTTIGATAFNACTGLTSVTIPNSVTSIGNQAFQNCTSLSSVTIGSGVTSIGNQAFRGCTSLASVTFTPTSSVVTIDYGAFKDCTSLTSITIPSGPVVMSTGLFWGCTSLTSVTIPNTVTTIGAQAFQDCTNLISITIPSSVANINSDAFKGCTKLATVNFLKSSPPGVVETSFYPVADGAIGYYPTGAADWSGVTITGLNLVSMPSGITGTSFTAVWALVVGATYTVEVSTTPLFGVSDIVRTVNATASETSKLITGLSANTNYWYRVIATIPAGATTTSSSVPVTTGAADLLIPAAPVLSGLPATMVYQQKVVLAGAVSALQRTTSTPTAIPDYNGAGISQTMTIAGLTAGTNYQVNLGINVSALGAGVLGDLQIYLQHTLVSGEDTIVNQTRTILDRVGVEAGDLTGSLATGLNVIMSDSGAFNIQGSPADSATPLTGTWQPASLLGGSSFGLSTMGTKGDGSFNWNGDWTLVVADLNDGGTMRLDSWSMQFSDLSASDTSVGSAGLEYELVAPSIPAKASISGNELEALSGMGTFQVRARYRAVDGISQVSEWTTKTIALTKKEQTITFAALGTRSLAPKFMAGATTVSLLPLTYSSSSTGTATIDGASGEITPVAVGTTTISVAQAGDENFSAATAVTQVLTIAGTPLNPAWGLSQLYSQDSTNRAVAGVTKGTNTYAYTKIEYAEASATAQIVTVPVTLGKSTVANLTQTNEVAPGVIGYSSPSNPASFTSYSSATNAVTNGNYVFVGKNSSSENVTNAVVNWSNNTNDYPVQAPQIGGTWVAQSLRLENPADPNVISWAAWTNTPVVGSTNSIRVEVTGSFGGGSLTSGPSSATEKFVTNLPANSTNLAIPAGTLPTNQVFSAKVAFVTMTGGAARSTETQFRMVTGPKNPPVNPVLPGALIGNINVAPGASAVGTLAVFSDLDAGDTETLSLPALTFPEGNDNYLFMLDGRTIKLAEGTFNYAMKPSYSILVRATDSYGLYSETAYTVSVQGAQTITFNDLATKTFGDVPFNLTATAPGGTVTYTSSDAGVATIEGSAVTIVGAGFADITASQAGGGAYLAAETVVKRLTVSMAIQAITGLAPTDSKTFGAGDYTLSVTKGASTSGLTFASSAPGVATINSTTGLVSIKGAGTTTLTVNQAADANYSAATQVSQTLTVNKASQTITGLAATDSKTFGAGDYTLSVTQGSSTSGLIFSSSAPGVATIHPATGLVSIKGAGSATLRVQQLADANYNAATQVSQTLTVNKATQAITGLAATDSKTFGAGDYTLSVTRGASSNGLIFASSAPGVATINSTTGLVSIKGSGTATLTVNQVADANYNAATQVSQTLTVNPAGSTITVTGLTSFIYSGSAQGPDTSTKSGSTGAVTYGYAGTGGTTYGPSPTKPTVVGSYTVTAAVANDANYGGAMSSPTAFTIGVQTLTIKADSNSRGYGAANPALTGSVESGAVLGESFVVTASTTATATSAPGSYSIVPDVTGSTLSNYTVSKTNGTLTVTSAPFAGEDALTAAPAPSTSTKYSFAQLLLNDRTFSGTLSITGVAAIPGVTQGTVSTKGSWAVYVPIAGALAGATDSFNYTLSNGTGTTTGTVTISLVSPDMTISVALASPPTLANGYKATFLVMPGLVFEAYGSDAPGGAYTIIGTTWTSASSGKLEVTDSAAAGKSSRFYKLKWLP